MTIITIINIRGGGDSKIQAIMDTRAKLTPDLLIISETRTLSRSLPTDLPAGLIVSEPGIAIIAKNPQNTKTIQKPIHNQDLLERTRLITLTLNDTTKINILATYGPAKQTDKAAFWTDLSSWYKDVDIIAGDLNIKDENSPLTEHVNTVNSLQDAGTILNNLTPTHLSTTNTRSRIDRFLVGPEIRPRLRKLIVTPMPPHITDHSAVTLYLDDSAPPTFCKHFPPIAKGKLAAVMEILNSRIPPPPTAPSIKEWTEYKRLIKIEMKKIASAEKNDPQSAAIIDLQNIFNIKSFHLSEIPFRRLAILKKQRANQQVFLAIKTDDPANPIADDQQSMIQTTQRFYTRLYSKVQCSTPHVRQLLEYLPSFPTDSFSDLGAPISREEVLDAINQMNPWKAPGSDGIYAAVYKSLFNTITSPLTHLFNSFLNGEKIPRSFKSGITSLLMKKGDPTDLANRRPITLLPTDYKVLSKVLTNRLKTHMHRLIGEEQTGFVPGRYILNNILAADLAFREFPDMRMDCYDLTKAYDSVSHKALHMTLEHLNFPTNFINLVDNMIKGSYTRCLVNGFLTERIPLNRGVKQGDPLSPLLFNIAIEPLACMLRNTLKPKIYPRILLYADDIAIFSQPEDDGAQEDRDNVRRAFQWLNKGFGLTINREKCCTVTGRPHSTDLFKASQCERYLGYFITPGGIKPCFSMHVENASATLSLWKQSRSSPVANASILKTFALSKLWFAAILTPIPKESNTSLQYIMDWFLWSKRLSLSTPGPKPRRKMAIDRSLMLSSEGGLQLFAFPQRFVALKASFLTKLLHNTPSWLKPLITAHLKTCEIDESFLEKVPPLEADAVASFSPLIGCLRAWRICLQHSKDPIMEETRSLIKELLGGNSWSRHTSAHIPTNTLYRGSFDHPKRLTPKQTEIQRVYNVNFQRFWNNKNKIPTTAYPRRIIEMFFNSTLPYYRKRPCKHCNTIIDRIHIFFTCPLAQLTATNILKALNETWHTKDPTPWEPSTVLQSFTEPSKDPQRTAKYATTFWLVWLAWCKCTYENIIATNHWTKLARHNIEQLRAAFTL